MTSQKSKSTDAKIKSVEEVVFVRRALGVDHQVGKSMNSTRPSSHKQAGMVRSGEAVLASPVGRPRSSVHPMQVNFLFTQSPSICPLGHI